MRSEFAARLDAFRQRIFHDSDYMRKYPIELFRLAEQELRSRNREAEERLRRLLDSGWKPSHPTAISAALRDCFAFSDYTQDPSSDLYACVEKMYSDIGLAEPAGEESPRRRLGRAQVEAAQEAVLNLETHVVKETPPTFVVHNTAPITGQQIGNNNVVNIQNTEIDRRSITNAIQVVSEHLDDFERVDRDDVEAHLAELQDEIQKPEPKPARLKAALNAIGRIAGPESIKAVVDGAVSGLIKGLGGV